MARDNDEAWRAIVENYGDRAQVDDLDLPPAPPSPEGSTGAVADDRPVAEPPARSWDAPDDDWETDRFVPPPPPPLPTTSKDRLAAWTGLFGSPAILLVCLVLGISLPALLAYALVAAFVGGFLYLVLKMSREPRDPGDNGAVL